jgi:hypothetical protein
MSGRTIVALICALLTVVSFARAQQSAPQPPAKSSAPTRLVLNKGTPVKLRFKRDLSSADAKPDDNIDFEVVSEVKVGDLLVIAKGSTAVGKVTAVEAARRMGRGGKLDIEMDSVTLADGEKASLWAVKEDSGEGNVGENRPIVARTLVFGPVAPILLVMEGADAMIPRDTEITGYVVDAMQLDPAKFTAAPNLAVVLANPISAQLEITSDPSGARVSVDGNYVDRTPSAIELAPGRHTITLLKGGFRKWERTLDLSAGKMTLAATLYPKEIKLGF